MLGISIVHLIRTGARGEWGFGPKGKRGGALPAGKMGQESITTGSVVDPQAKKCFYDWKQDLKLR